MESLQTFFAENHSSDIFTIGRYIEQHINEHWEVVYQNCRGEMVDLYAKIGDSAYGLYGVRLFQPIHAQFKQAGLRAMPRLPGSFTTSRE